MKVHLTIAGGLRKIAEGIGVVPQREAVVPFAPEALVTELETKPRLGRVVRREPLWEGYFHLHALRAEYGELLGLDWRKGPHGDASPSPLDPKTAIVIAFAEGSAHERPVMATLPGEPFVLKPGTALAAMTITAEPSPPEAHRSRGH